MTIKQYLILTLLLIGCFLNANSCTIFSGIDKKGQVWAGNNEDNLFSFNTYLNLAKSTDSTFGYFYFTNSNSPNEYIQGGVNDAGLFYDGNSVPASVYKDFDKKKDFPGGHRAMLKYVLGKCKTVQEVIALFREFRLPGTETGQLQFADKYGNLGIIVADSMWITKATYQVSTNYNLCHADNDGQTCWRYPIAERILKSKGAGIDSFREICDSTSQKNVSSTIYSNIQNLSTGEIWFYYAMDFNKPYKINIQDLLKSSDTSFPLYELFKDSPLVMVYKSYQTKGIEASLEKLHEYKLPIDRQNLVVRLLYFDLIIYNHDFKSYPILYDFIKANFTKSKNEADELLKVLNALALFCTDRKTEALLVLNKYKAEQPEGEWMDFVNFFSDQMQGVFEKNSNVKFELNGYKNAKYVFIEGIDYPNFTYFLVQKEGKWIGEFKLAPDEYHYVFFVDGQRVLDPTNSDIIKEMGLENNRLVVEK